ncbi:hypothetical protein JQX13_14580 [Archangium violaceum]|uniref:hypothetical protein n=1 Tax=Archangium violaceum TaxID=83451 RepID=UPI00193C52FF|nr:hypothetical protein [Archangium violaceum]QRK11185.1 hypothetical protein JQX13_14580 [Archangium violaceum]
MSLTQQTPMTAALDMVGVTSSTYQRLNDIIDSRYSPHPFEAGVESQHLRPLLQNYLAMSQAFPYLQAGAQKELIFDAIQNDHDVPEDVEITSVVGNYLCWDETGGHFTLTRHGISGLPRILETRKTFHANHLRRDIERLVGTARPSYAPVTREYLTDLYEGLAHASSLERCATMVAFELHAQRMISGLWGALAAAHPDIQKDELSYFRIHVGGEDPAEPYHVALTCGMLERLVPPEQQEKFLERFEVRYARNVAWCRDIRHLGEAKVVGKS